MFFLRTDEIDWIEAVNNMEARLDTRRFVRIHCSRIVNTDRIKELQPWLKARRSW